MDDDRRPKYESLFTLGIVLEAVIIAIALTAVVVGVARFLPL